MKLKHSLCFLVLPIMLFSCTPQESSQSSSVNEEIPDNLQIKWTDCLNQEDNDYLVFFHSDTCSQCKEIMGDVIAFSSQNIKKLYFSNIVSDGVKMPIEKEKEEITGVSNIEDFYIRGTPTIIEVVEGTVTAHVAGKNACLTFLNNERLNNKN